MKKIKLHTLCKVDEQTFVYLLHTHRKRKKTKVGHIEYEGDKITNNILTTLEIEDKKKII